MGLRKSLKRIGKKIRKGAKSVGRKAAPIRAKIAPYVTGVVAAGATLLIGPVGGLGVTALGRRIGAYSGATAARARGIRGHDARQAGYRVARHTTYGGLIGTGAGLAGAGLVSVISGGNVVSSLTTGIATQGAIGGTATGTPALPLAKGALGSTSGSIPSSFGSTAGSVPSSFGSTALSTVGQAALQSGQSAKVASAPVSYPGAGLTDDQWAASQMVASGGDSFTDTLIKAGAAGAFSALGAPKNVTKRYVIDPNTGERKEVEDDGAGGMDGKSILILGAVALGVVLLARK